LAPHNFLPLKSRPKSGQFWAFWGALLPTIAEKRGVESKQAKKKPAPTFLAERSRFFAS
jgi:hypothetical protein